MGLAITAGFACMLLADHLQSGKGHLSRSDHDSDEDLQDAEGGLMLPSQESRSLQVSVLQKQS